MRFVALALLCLSCGSAPAPCSPEALAVVYEEVAGNVIDAGLCDKYAKVEDCPAYALLEAEFTLAAEASCRR